MRKLIDVINDIAKLNSKERTIQEEMKYNNLFAELIAEEEMDIYVETREGYKPSKVTTNHFKYQQGLIAKTLIAIIIYLNRKICQ